MGYWNAGWAPLTRIFLTGFILVITTACTLFTDPASPTGGASGILVVSRFADVQRVGEKAKPLGSYALGRDQTFTLSFIHSVSLTRVKDIYQIRGGKILQTQEIFQAHGAGLPTSPEEPFATAFEKTKEGFVLHMERPIKTLVVRTDKRYENRLSLAGITVDLNQWEDQGLLIQFYPNPKRP